MPRTSKQGAGTRARRKQRQSRAERSEHTDGSREMQSSDQGGRARSRPIATAKALVIGIDQYGGAPNDLTCCAVDADTIARLLEDQYGFQEVRALRDDEASVERVEEELDWLAEESRPGDRRVVYFSGHGATRLRNGLMEECLVLSDGFLESDPFTERATTMPPGVLTMIIDASFTGGPETYVTDPTGAATEVELARVKTWVPVGEDDETGEAAESGETRKVSGYRRFACLPVVTTGVAAGTVGAVPQGGFGGGQIGPWGLTAGAERPAGERAPSTRWSSDRRPGELEFDGLLLLASHESEPAVGNTSKTDGLSAFTYALIQSMQQLGINGTANDLVAITGQRLRALGVRQTPRLVESSRTGDLRFRRMLSVQPAPATEGLHFIAEPKFWEGVLAAAAPHVTTTWAASRREGDVMTAAYQPMTGSQQNPFGTTQGFGATPFGAQQLSPDELQRIVPTLAPVLANVVPALVPAIVNAIITQQRSGTGISSGAFGWGGGAQSGYGLGQTYQAGLYGQQGDEVQKMLPVLAPVLANVIPAIVPQILQHVIMQQRQTQGWGGSPLTGTPFQSLGGIGSQGAFGNVPYGTNPELWQVVSHSVNDALHRIGLTTGQTGGRF